MSIFFLNPAPAGAGGRELADWTIPVDHELMNWCPNTMHRMTDIGIRPAVVNDVPAIVAMLADDKLGATRESPDDLRPYLAACERLQNDPNQFLMVAVRDDLVVGTLQLTVIPGLSRRGSTRSIIGGVRVHSSQRGQGPVITIGSRSCSTGTVGGR